MTIDYQEVLDLIKNGLKHYYYDSENGQVTFIRKDYLETELTSLILDSENG
jgi:hypothetical protein